MLRLTTLAGMLALGAGPALAATGPFVSLRNTDFVVLLAFLLFIAVLIYFKVPGIVLGLLDKRAIAIKADLEDARNLREEAQTVLASYERKQKEVQEQADRIVATAKQEANAAGEQAKLDLEASITRRIASAKEQIASAEAAAVKDVRDQAIVVAIAAAREVIAKQMTATDSNRLIDDAVSDVAAKLH